MKKIYYLIVLSLAFILGIVCELIIESRGLEVTALQSGLQLLHADLNQDSKYEHIFIDQTEKVGSSYKMYLVVEQDHKEFLRIPYYGLFKEPFRNTSIAIYKKSPKPHLLVKGGPNAEEIVYEFNGERLVPINASEEEKRIFKSLSPWM